VNKEDPEDGATDSQILTIASDHPSVIDLTVSDCGNGNHPLICAAITTDVLLDDKENKGKKPLDTYVQFKGRGRYKVVKCAGVGTGLPVLLTVDSRPKSETLNAAFEIDPDTNGGLNYAYDAVVRNKEERRKMHGSDCECCKEVGFPPFRPLPPQSALNYSYRSTIAPSARYHPVSMPHYGVRLPPRQNSRRPCSRHP